MKTDYMCAMAIIDFYSQYIESWSISNTMVAAWCKLVFIDAIETPDEFVIINTGQGIQFTS
jgi:transposase InsO family protein